VELPVLAVFPEIVLPVHVLTTPPKISVVVVDPSALKVRVEPFATSDADPHPLKTSVWQRTVAEAVPAAMNTISADATEAARPMIVKRFMILPWLASSDALCTTGCDTRGEYEQARTIEFVKA
jgi:hypothetical protein